MKTFAVTAGHGAGHPGNTWGGYSEALLMTELRDIVVDKLTQAGHTVRVDGARKENMSLKEAVRLIQGTDLAIELHTNAHKPDSAGVEVIAQLSHKAQAQKLAKAIARVLEIPVRRDGGFFRLETFIEQQGYTPAFVRHGGLIVEVFFQSNQEELAKYLARKWLVASAIVGAIAS